MKEEIENSYRDMLEEIRKYEATELGKYDQDDTVNRKRVEEEVAKMRANTAKGYAVGMAIVMRKEGKGNRIVPGRTQLMIDPYELMNNYRMNEYLGGSLVFNRAADRSTVDLLTNGFNKKK